MTLAEEAWEGIRAQLDLRPGLWLAWIFSDEPQVLAELRRRTDEHSRARALQTRHRVLATDDDVATAPEWLLGLGELADTPVAAVWLTDRGDRDDQGWRDVWARTLVRLNEMVDVLREALPCGLLIGAQPWVMPMVRDLAPGLWALRAVATPVETAEPDSEVADWAEVLTVELALADAAEPSPTMAALIEEVAADPRPERVAETLLARLPGLPDDMDRAFAHTLLADVRRQQGDRVGARRLAARALAFGRPLGLALTFEALAVIGSSAAVERLVEICRALLARDGETHEMIGRLWANLVNAAEFAPDPETRAVYLEEALTAAARLHDEHGDSQEHLADAAETAAMLAEALLEAERPDDARQYAVLSVQFATDLGGRLLGVNLRVLAQVELALDQPEQALAAYRDAHDVSYASYVRRAGVTAEDLGALCLELGTLRSQMGHLDEAEADLTYALELARHSHDEHADDVNAVSLLAATLAGNAELHVARGRLDDAHRASTESVELTRRLFDRSNHLFGNSLVERMHGLADVLAAQNQHDRAKSIRDEATFLADTGSRTTETFASEEGRGLRAGFPDTPLALDAQWRALYDHATLLIRDDPKAAIATLTEATQVAERLLARVGERPDVLYALYTLYDRCRSTSARSTGSTAIERRPGT